MRTFITACALAFMAMPTPAAADPGTVDSDPVPLSRTIAIGDLDLGSAAGSRILQRRIGDAVDDLCAEAVGSDNGSPDFKFAMMRCRKLAWSEARMQSDPLMAAAVRPSALAISVRISGSPAR